LVLIFGSKYVSVPLPFLLCDKHANNGIPWTCEQNQHSSGHPVVYSGVVSYDLPFGSMNRPNVNADSTSGVESWKLQLNAGVEHGIVNLPTRDHKTSVNSSCDYENIANTQSGNIWPR
jgi:hypothetical protein